jgi:tRNA G10  N-methylase Trm11
MLSTGKNTYLSLHVSGFSETVNYALKQRFSDVSILEQSDGLAVYETAAPIGKVSHNPMFSNTFVVLADFPAELPSPKILELVAAKIAGFSVPFANAKSFRVIYSHNGQLVPIEPTILAKLEAMITSTTGIVVNKARPDVEFWVISRANEKSYFGMRASNFTINTTEPEELRSDLATLLCYVSEPQKNDVFLDSFCGSGAIPLARAKLGKYTKIYGYDSDGAKISKLRAVSGSGMVFSVGDARNMAMIADASITKIVTDPPWGLYDKEVGDIIDLYEKALKEFHRVLSENGILVLLLSRELASGFLFDNTGFSIEASYEVLVAGKKASVYKLLKA